MSKQLKTLTLGTVREVIRLAEDCRIEADAEEAKNPEGAVIGADFMERMAKGPGQKSLALRNLVKSLPDDQKDELLALMWLGRADADETVEMWSDLVAAAHGEEHKSSALLGKSPLGIYLSKGLECLEA
jgi:hypothetical protein